MPAPSWAAPTTPSPSPPRRPSASTASFFLSTSPSGTFLLHSPLTTFGSVLTRHHATVPGQEPRLHGPRAPLPRRPHLHDHALQLPVRAVCPAPSLSSLSRLDAYLCMYAGSTSWP